MKSSAVVSGQTATATQYNDLRQDAKGASSLLAHQKTVPDLQLYVESGVVYVGGARVNYAGGNSPSITNPTVNPRIAILLMNSLGVLSWIYGSEAVSPTAPTIPSDRIPIAEVYQRVGSTTILDADAGSNSYIRYDLRNILEYVSAGGDLNNTTVAYNTNGLISTVTDNDTGLVWTLTYNGLDLISTITNGANTWTFSWSSDDQLTGVVKT